MIRPMLKASRPCGMPTPQKTSSTSAGSTSGLRSSSWSTTKAPVSSGRNEASEPLKARPIGVRTVSTITASGIWGISLRARWRKCGPQGSGLTLRRCRSTACGHGSARWSGSSACARASSSCWSRSRSAAPAPASTWRSKPTTTASAPTKSRPSKKRSKPPAAGSRSRLAADADLPAAVGNRKPCAPKRAPDEAAEEPVETAKPPKKEAEEAEAGKIALVLNRT